MLDAQAPFLHRVCSNMEVDWEDGPGAARLLEPKLWLPHRPAVPPSASYLTSLCLGVLIHQRGWLLLG